LCSELLQVIAEYPLRTTLLWNTIVILFTFLNDLDVLSMATEAAPGADEFLPCLIYVVIKANPPDMAANLEYAILLLIVNSKMF